MPGNSLHVDFLTVEIAGVFYPVTFGGALGVNIDNCRFVWSDPLRNSAGALVTLSPNTVYYIRSSQTVAVNGNLASGGGLWAVQPRWTNAYWGDGVNYTTTVQTAKRTSGTVSAYSEGSSILGPAMAMGTGWDGSAVYAPVGDSIGWGEGDSGFAASAISGYIERALSDSGSGARNWYALTFPGTKPDDQSDIGAGHYQRRMEALRSIGNIPFNQILSEMGQNSPTIAGASLAPFQAVETDWWRFWHNNCPACGMFQTTFPAHAGSFSNTKFTTQADQATDYPTGVRWQADAWIKGAAGPALPGYLRGINTTDAFTTASGLTDNAGNWPTTGWSGTLAATYASNVNQVAVTAATAPANGTVLVFEPATSNADVVYIDNVTGSAPNWTVTFAGTTGKAHNSGAAVATATTYEGTHPQAPLHQAAANVLIGLKSSGALP